KALREDQRSGFNALNRKLDALGARWGILAEGAFREGMRGIVEELLGVASVGKWTYNDASGEVYGKPSMVEVDLVIKNNEHILVEIKANISKGDVLEFWRIGKLYEEVNSVKPRLIMITPYIDEKAMELAKELSIEVYTP
ncbi:PD-(D/E)XK nuclease family protein, partial [Caldivirga sp. UBA161]|uniref:PD-(D/E)XK nuclease family protein n=1 Tax=Caldivirga sp. UBA161 TaxID=1915569 RepID=UPI0025C0D111